jgi:hypothetical protein
MRGEKERLANGQRFFNEPSVVMPGMHPVSKNIAYPFIFEKKTMG